MQYYPQRNKSAAARAYVKQSIKAVRYIWENCDYVDTLKYECFRKQKRVDEGKK